MVFWWIIVMLDLLNYCLCTIGITLLTRHTRIVCCKNNPLSIFCDFHRIQHISAPLNKLAWAIKGIWQSRLWQNESWKFANPEMQLSTFEYHGFYSCFRRKGRIEAIQKFWQDKKKIPSLTATFSDSTWLGKMEWWKKEGA